MRMRRAVDLTDPMVTALIDTTVVLEQRLFERAQNPFMQNLRMDAEISIGPNFWMRSQALVATCLRALVRRSITCSSSR